MTSYSHLDCCFCSLALGATYRGLALKLSQDIAQKAPGISLIILTDNPKDFVGIDRVIAIHHKHCFGYRPYNDKVFVLEAALQRFSVAIQIDVDIEFTQNILKKITQPWSEGITGRSESLLTHTDKNNSRDLPHIKKLARKLDLCLEDVTWIGEHMFVVRRDNGREKIFLSLWKKLAFYWDIHKLGAKDGTLIGLAAAKAGWNVSLEYWQELNSCLAHFDVHHQIQYGRKKNEWDKWSYRVRRMRAQLLALREPDFYH
jgi:hypothetical protein